MSDRVSERDWSAFHEITLADAIDRLFAMRAEATAARWLQKQRSEGLSKHPDLNELRCWLGSAWWDAFSPFLQTVGRDHDDLMGVFYDDRRLYEARWAERVRCFSEATLPLVQALLDRRIGAVGLKEPEDAHGWEPEAVPPGYFRPNRWILYRSGSRLVTLDRAGRETAPAYNDVRLAVAAVAGETVGAAPATAEEVAIEIGPSPPAVPPASHASIRMAARGLYRELQAHPPNVRDANKLIRGRLPGATARNVEIVLSETEFQELRRPSGKPPHRGN